LLQRNIKPFENRQIPILARPLLCELHSSKNICIVQKTRGLRMKYIIAIVKPHKLDDVREALTGIGVAGMTVSEVKGFGRQKGQTENYRGAEYTTNMVPKVKIEVACSADTAAAVVEAIQAAAGTGSIGDGKIFEFDLVGATRIRTGDLGETAL
jgi:nitrogen regulatory protein P-II 2